MKKHNFYLITLLMLFSFSITTKGQTNTPLIYQTFVGEDPRVDGGQIAILNAQTLEQIDKILITPATPEVITLSKDGKSAFVLHSPIITGKQGLTVVDLKEKSKRILFEDKELYGVRLATDGMVWVLVEEDSQIVVVNPSTLQITKTIQLPEPARDIVFSSDGKKAYTSLLTKNIVEIDINSSRTGRTVNNLPQRDNFQLRPQELEISTDNTKLFISGQNTISIIDIGTFTIETISLPIRSTSLVLKITPDGRFIYAAEYLGADFAILELATKQARSFRTPNNTGILSAVNISPNGTLAYISGFYGISIFDVEKQSFIKNIQTSPGIGFPNPFSLGLALSGDFTLGQAPTLTAISPSNGDNLFANQQIQINWQTTVAPQSFSIASHKVELSTNGGQSFTTIPGAEELPATAQSFTWTVPNITSSNAQIRVSTVDLGAKRAASTTGTFSILQSAPIDNMAPTVTFNSPVGGESFTSGSNLAIAWVSSDNVGVTSQDLSLSLDGGQTFPITIAAGLTGSTQSFSFPIPQDLATTQARLRLVVRDAAGNVGQSTTASNFSIQAAIDNVAPTVTISQPTSNSNVMAGSPIQVNWASTDNRAVVSQSLLLSLNGGQSFTTVASFGANDSSFLLNNINGLSLTTPQAIVRIIATDQAGNTGQANTTFIISPMVMMANYQAKILSVSGIGFMSNSGNSNSNLQVFINGKQVNVAAMNLTNNSFSLKGNKKKLNLVKGSNTINLVIDGVMSNQISFQF